MLILLVSVKSANYSVNFLLKQHISKQGHKKGHVYSWTNTSQDLQVQAAYSLQDRTAHWNTHKAKLRKLQSFKKLLYQKKQKLFDTRSHGGLFKAPTEKSASVRTECPERF